MIHHIVLWNLKEDLSKQERLEAALEIKRRLEAVADTAEGVISLQVVINQMESSNKDIALISRFETEEALKAYQVSPAHVEAGEYVRSVTTGRSCFDFKE
ncbi:MAG: Dabb family protein [Lachnospiraceae bacterium]|nr:Dabb family protein [Lachnospiraceae bacterium]MDE6185637.1 Dabb family protein [Lachnospiraceae bacterium]MDE7287416.1 Dabb family protein [Lachnospiraceae bacterium]